MCKQKSLRSKLSIAASAWPLLPQLMFFLIWWIIFLLYFPCPFQWKLGHAVPAILEYLHCPLYESYNRLYSTIYWILGNGIHVKMDCTPFDFALSRLRTNSFQIAQPQCQAVRFRPSLVCARVTVGCKRGIRFCIMFRTFVQLPKSDREREKRASIS